MSVLGLIPARGGSRGVKRKNLRVLGPAPLFQWAIRAARQAGIDTVAVSTEDEEIRVDAIIAGANVIERPEALAQDGTPMLAVVEHALGMLAYANCDTIALLQPTTPFRRPERIREALELLKSTGADSAVSVVQIPPEYDWRCQFSIHGSRLVPVWGEFERITRRQDMPAPAAMYIRDGGFYVFRRKSFEKWGSIYGKDCRAVVVTPEEALNINTEADWQEAERRLLVHA